MTEHNTRLGDPLAFRYKYDQLNRLVNMDAFNNPFTAPAHTPDYKEQITYDPNGNIVSYLRNGATTDKGEAMDNLSYTYNKTDGRLTNNQLRFVTDGVSANAYPEDIDSPEEGITGDYYKYDGIGNLVNEGNKGISWNVYGKISKIVGLPNNFKLSYAYDAAGNRVEKIYYNGAEPGSAGSQTHYTWYVRDAQGNTMAVYESKSGAEVRLTETHLYGSSRLGVANAVTKKPVPIAGHANAKKHTFTRGEKFFETNLMQLIYIQC